MFRAPSTAGSGSGGQRKIRHVLRVCPSVRPCLESAPGVEDRRQLVRRVLAGFPGRSNADGAGCGNEDRVVEGLANGIPKSRIVRCVDALQACSQFGERGFGPRHGGPGESGVEIPLQSGGPFRCLPVFRLAGPARPAQLGRAYAARIGRRVAGNSARPGPLDTQAGQFFEKRLYRGVFASDGLRDCLPAQFIPLRVEVAIVPGVRCLPCVFPCVLIGF